MSTYAAYYGIELPADSDVRDNVNYGWAGTEFTGTLVVSGGGGGTDWTADERTAIRTILGVPTSGTTPEVPSAGALKVIKTVTDKLNTTLVLDGSVYQFTVNALENGPSGAGGGGSATLANQELILDAIADLSGIQPTIISSFDPITKAITLVRNDAYLNALGTAIEIPVNIPTGVDATNLDGARLGAKYKHGSITLVGNVELVEIGSHWTARIEFPMTATAGKALGEYAYDVEITFDGQDITILSGSLRLVEDYSTH